MISFVIPACNEEESIGKVIGEIKRTMEKVREKYEILIVSNSTDQTDEIARRLGATVIREERKGYGRAYKTGFKKAKGRIIVTGDADCSYPFSEVPKLLKILEKENLDFITTNRFAKMEKGAMPFLHKIGNLILTFFTFILFGVRVKDSQSGMWVFRREFLRKIKLEGLSDGMAFSQEIKILAFTKGKAKEVPVSYRKRAGRKKLRSFRDGIGNLISLFKFSEYYGRD